ncbi:MAG TPA: sulfur carrier protein ThiS [Caulobacteraceae bacterium]|nr:sulfur carrier protein ThiS [Caulobacteraceae bacterium]
MRLIVNGEEKVFEATGNLAGLIAHLGVDERKVAVEHNLAIVPRSFWPATSLAEGDRIEIVHFVGGG